MKISGHCLIQNEENFVWFALNSVIDHVDELLVWDTGSTDRTVEIVKTINNPKIKFKEIGKVTPRQLSEARQKMVSETTADWIFLIDGDEIWSENNIKNIVTKLDVLKIEKLVVNKSTMLIGDMYHYLEDKAGQYRIYDKLGHYTIRFMRNFPGICVGGDYPNEYYADSNNVPVQNFSKEKIYFTDETYLHASFLQRSPKDNKKIKYELGVPFPLDYFYPEVFFKDRPKIVPSPWKSRDEDYIIKAFWQTPLKKLKRRIV